MGFWTGYLFGLGSRETEVQQLDRIYKGDLTREFLRSLGFKPQPYPGLQNVHWYLDEPNMITLRLHDCHLNQRNVWYYSVYENNSYKEIHGFNELVKTKSQLLRIIDTHRQLFTTRNFKCNSCGGKELDKNNKCAYCGNNL